MREYAIGIFPNVKWSVAYNVTPVENSNVIRVGAAYDEEKKMGLITLVAYGFKVQVQISGEAHELHTITFGLERAREIIKAYTGNEMPLMMTAPKGASEDVVEDVKESAEDTTEPAEEPTEPTKATEESDAEVPVLQ